MVRLSNSNDIDGIIAVWKEAFGDSEDDIRFFLNAHYVPDNTLLYEHEDVITSVLFLLDGDMHINGMDYPSFYLYAACTLKEFRGRGMMADLLEFAKETASSREKLFIALKPASDSLYNYYSSFGYKAVFSKKITEIDILSDNELIKELTDNSIHDDYNYFKWDKKSIEFAIEHHKHYGGIFYETCNGFVLYSINNGVLSVKENTLSDCDFAVFLKYCAKEYNISKVVAQLPFKYISESEKSCIIKSGMLLPLCDYADLMIENSENYYLSLTLD